MPKQVDETSASSPVAAQENYGALPKTGFVRQSQLIPAPVPFSSATLWRRVKAGTFPKPVKLSAGVTAWRVEDVRAWIAAQADTSPVPA